MNNFKSNFLSRGQLGSKSNDKIFLSVLKMRQCCKYFFGNLIFALTARTLSGNSLNWGAYVRNGLFSRSLSSEFTVFYDEVLYIFHGKEHSGLSVDDCNVNQLSD